MDGLHRDLIREKVNGSVCVCERGGGVCTWYTHCRRQAHFCLMMSDREVSRSNQTGPRQK